MTKRRRFTADFKARVALEAVVSQGWWKIGELA